MEFYWKVAPALYSGLMIGLMIALIRAVHRYPPRFLSGVKVRVPWKKFGGWWIVAGLLFGAADVVTTLIAGIENELNPIVIYYLVHWGAGAFVAVKLADTALFMLVWRLFEAFPPPALRFFQALAVVVTMGLQAVVVASNLYFLLR